MKTVWSLSLKFIYKLSLLPTAKFSELRANIVPIYSFLSKGSEDPIPLVENGFVDFPRRQLLPNFFYPTAQFEIIDIEESKRQAIFYPKPVIGSKVSESGIDIDSEIDYRNLLS